MAMKTRGLGFYGIASIAGALLATAAHGASAPMIFQAQRQTGAGAKNYHKGVRSSRYDGEELRRLRAERGVGPRKRIDPELVATFTPTRRW